MTQENTQRIKDLEAKVAELDATIKAYQEKVKGLQLIAERYRSMGGVPAVQRSIVTEAKV